MPKTEAPKVKTPEQSELDAELAHCMKVFPELRGMPALIYYKNIQPNILGQTRIKKVALTKHGKKRVTWLPVIEVSTRIRDASADRRSLLRYVIVHELVHISRLHLSKSTSADPHETDFNKEVAERLTLLQKV